MACSNDEILGITGSYCWDQLYLLYNVSLIIIPNRSYFKNDQNVNYDFSEMTEKTKLLKVRKTLV